MTIRELLKDLKLSNLNTQIVTKEWCTLTDNKEEHSNDC